MHTKKLNPYLAFKDGQCKKAMNFYKNIFQAEITFSQTYGESPMKAMMDTSEHDLILHGEVKNDWLHLMCSDAPKGFPYTQGNNMNISLNFDSPSEQKKIFDQLQQGGKIIMPLKEEHWSAIFGMLIDPFGISWVLNCQTNK